jgi:hypothetical protein
MPDYGSCAGRQPFRNGINPIPVYQQVVGSQQSPKYAYRLVQFNPGEAQEECHHESGKQHHIDPPISLLFCSHFFSQFIYKDDPGWFSRHCIGQPDLCENIIKEIFEDYSILLRKCKGRLDANSLTILDSR